jgi:hypothetical protein
MTKKDERKTKEDVPTITAAKPEKSADSVIPQGKHVRISVNGVPEKVVGGLRFTKTPTHYKPGSLKWEEEDWKAAHADPHLVIEEVDEAGTPVKKA